MIARSFVLFFVICAATTSFARTEVETSPARVAQVLLHTSVEIRAHMDGMPVIHQVKTFDLGNRVTEFVLTGRLHRSTLGSRFELVITESYTNNRPFPIVYDVKFKKEEDHR